MRCTVVNCCITYQRVFQVLVVQLGYLEMSDHHFGETEMALRSTYGEISNVGQNRGSVIF